MSRQQTFKQRVAAAAIRLGLQLCDFIIGPTTMVAQGLQLFRMRYLRLKPRPGDIYIATAAKAGTTWMQQIVYQLVTAGRGEFDHIYQVSPFLEELLGVPWAERVLDELPSPRILKTHLYYGVLRPPADSRIIYVTRDAADALVSLHNHRVMCSGFGRKLDTAFFHGDPWVGIWFSHLESWWKHRNDANVLHVRYEDLVKDLEGSIRRVARFLDLSLQEDRMADILEKCGFAYMKQHNARFDTRLAFFDKSAPRPVFIRKGLVGDGRTGLPEDLRAALTHRMGQLRRKLGLNEADL